MGVAVEGWQYELALYTSTEIALFGLGQILGLTDEVVLAGWNARGNYKEFSIPKKSGGRRVIHWPCEDLSRVQEMLNAKVLNRCKVPPELHGYIKKRDPFTAAKAHFRPKCPEITLITLDLKDAFHQITAERVHEIFTQLLELKDPHAFRNVAASNRKALAECLSELTTRQGILPMGSPSSPMLLNLACAPADDAIRAICNRRGLIWTRYGDDICVSGPGEVPKSVIVELVAAIEDLGFVINRKKIGYHRSTRVVPHMLGLLIHGSRIWVPAETIEKLRDFLLQAIHDPGITEQQVEGTLGWVRRLNNKRLPPRLAKRYIRYRNIVEERRQEDAKRPQLALLPIQALLADPDLDFTSEDEIPW